MVEIIKYLLFEIVIQNFIDFTKSIKKYFMFLINIPIDAFVFNCENPEVEIIKIKKFVNNILILILIIASIREILGVNYDTIEELFDQLCFFIFYFFGLLFIFIFSFFTYYFNKTKIVDKSKFLIQNIKFYNLIFLFSLSINIINIGEKLEQQNFYIVFVPTCFFSIVWSARYLKNKLKLNFFIITFHLIIITFLQLIFTLLFKEFIYNKI